MVRTQIQLPDALHERLKRLAERQEWSLAEVVRRAAEAYLDTFPAEPIDAAEWSLPAPRDLGEFAAPVDRWRELANDRTP